MSTGSNGWLTAVIKSGYMLGSPSIRRYQLRSLNNPLSPWERAKVGATQGDNASGADNQQERPRMPWSSDGPSKSSAESSETIRQTPVGTSGKIWSDLYGDIQRSAEMTGPSGNSIRPAPGRGGYVRVVPRVTKCLR